MSFFNKQETSLKNSYKDVLFLSKTHSMHREHIPTTILNDLALFIISDENKSI